MPIDTVGNTLSAARSIALSTSTQTWSEWVGAGDSQDFYKFSLSGRSSLNLGLNGLANNADVQLIRDVNSNGTIDSGDVLKSSGQAGITAEAISTYLDAGNYFIRVYQRSGDTNYNLSVASTLLPADLAGNTLGTARSISLSSTAQSWTDFVNGGDTQDFYKFNITARSAVNLGLTGLTNNADLQLIRDVNLNGVIDSGDTIATSGKTGTTHESLLSYLDTGTYFARVYQRSGDTSYTFQSSATVLPNDYAGNTLTSARAISLTGNTQAWNDSVNGGDTQDFYKFSIGARSVVTLGMSGLTNNADLQLIRDVNSNGVIDSGDTIATSGKTGTTNESLLSYLDAGTYFARVYQRSGDTNYAFQASATVLPKDYAGNTIAAAKVINLSPTAQISNDWVGNDDTNDYYKFTVTAQSDVRITLDGMSANANVRLLDSNNVVLKYSTNTGTIADTITSALAAGTYYIQVYRNSIDQTNYRLTTLATPVDTDNTIATARAATIGISQSGTLASYDLSDFYRFTLTGTASDYYSVNLGLTGLTGDANFDLLDSSGLLLNRSNLTGTSNENISRLLGTGTYYLKVWNGGTSNLNYTVNLASNIAPPTTDWYSANLKDAGLVNAVRIAGSDGNLSRVDWISVFRNSQDDGTISTEELSDFNTILSNASRWVIGNDVKTLSKKLLSTDKANLTFQGASLGVLTAGSSATQMENLIGKWFLGLDRPTPTSTSYSYRSISGSLFQNGISTTDVKQGQVGDCYFLATLGSIAQEQPNYIQNMFIDNGDNTWTVRFNKSGVWDYVTVDRFLPTNSSGNLVYASQGSNFANTANELWVALAEKAYAQIGESGWTRGTSRTNSYQSIEGGWMTYVINQVTGLNSTWSWSGISSLTEQTVINWVNSNTIVTLGTGSNPGNNLVGGHAYAITSYNASNGTFFVRNPWATQHVELTWAQLMSSNVDLAYSV